MYSRSNNNFGVNTSISLDPSSSSQTSQSITNNIIVRAATGEDNLPLVERSIEITDSKSEQEIQEEKLRFDEILLDVYKSILLTQNKVLLTNILSKKHIIIYKTDLEKVEIIYDYIGCPDDVTSEVIRKWEVNKSRKWEWNGKTYKHIGKDGNE